MRRMLLALAGAAALIPGPAAAQRRTVDDGPRPLPDVRIHAPGATAGTSWRAPDAAPETRGAREVEPVGFEGAERFEVPGRAASIGRGGQVPAPFLAPDYTIADHGSYGLAPPARGLRWVRHHDDALLVDRYGRVRDVAGGTFDVYRGRYGFSAEDRDADHPDRLVRDDGSDLAYDRDYPYEYSYGGEGVEGGRSEEDELRRRYPGGYTVTETTVTTVTPDSVRPARPGEIAPRRRVRRR